MRATVLVAVVACASAPASARRKHASPCRAPAWREGRRAVAAGRRDPQVAADHERRHRRDAMVGMPARDRGCACGSAPWVDALAIGPQGTVLWLFAHRVSLGGQLSFRGSWSA